IFQEFLAKEAKKSEDFAAGQIQEAADKEAARHTAELEQASPKRLVKDHNEEKMQLDTTHTAELATQLAAFWETTKQEDQDRNAGHAAELRMLKDDHATQLQAEHEP
ncbi:hypothetical protein T484DRAFT_1826632, partial [Baffinella frigidus]